MRHVLPSRRFLGFLALSGAGWLCDVATFALLTRAFELPPFAANVASSYVGVTFVWFTSLKTVFRKAGSHRALALYWTYQLLSILAYSQLLQAFAVLLPAALPAHLQAEAGLVAKIVITPFNLVTNFLFMQYLTRSLRPHR